MTPAPVARLARWPAAAPALAWPGGTLTYGELRARVETLAEAAQGAPPGPLPIVASSRLDMALGVLAALRLGRPALPLDPARPDLDACLAACAPAPASTSTCISTSRSKPETASDIALMVPTSGTTGTARIAMLSAAALDAHVAASAAVLPPLGPGDRWLVCLPMTSIGALAALWRTLSAGACLGLLERFDAGEARRFMASGASHVSIVPAMLAPLADAVAPEPRDLRCLLSGGGPLSTATAAIAQARGWPLWNGWGMTETCSHVAVGPVDAHWREGAVGRPLPGVVLELEAPDGRLAIRGPMLMSGYARPGLAPGDGLEADGRFRSGDLGELVADGTLRVTGRADDVIVTGGVNVHPQAVEQVLERCPGAGEVAVGARPDPRWGRVLVALYTGDAQAGARESWARAHLPSASRPREFRRVTQLPRNAMGKLLRAELAPLLR
jgi:O-succinylbenzoic acid--CoA ligase